MRPPSPELPTMIAMLKDGHTYKEIAEKVHKSIGNVQHQLNKRGYYSLDYF